MPDASEASQYSAHSTVMVTPGRIISRATDSWSISALAASSSGLAGNKAALIASSPISPGRGHSNPLAFALSTTFLTVVLEHPHEYAMFRMLIPAACSLRISRYLTICFPFSHGHGALCACP